MRIKGSLLKGLLIALMISLIPLVAFSAQKISSGSICKVYKQKVTHQNKVYTCIKSGKKLIWNKGIEVVKPSPAPTVTVTASPSPAPTVTVTATPTPTPNAFTRNIGDKPDEVDGFQIKVVYVVPKDGKDRELDLDGSLQKIVTEGNNFLTQEIQRKFPVDSWQGNYDIEFFRSTLTKLELISIRDAHRVLFNEMKIFERKDVNRKMYSFWIDVDSLDNGTACGYSNINDNRHAIAIGPQCSGRSAQFEDNRVTAWVHESLHGIGVEDTNGDGCEFLSHEPCTLLRYKIDPERKFYVGVSTVAGSDILKRRVWSGFTKDASLLMPCRMLENLEGICTIGRNIIGPPRSQWTDFSSAILQDVTDSNPVSVGNGIKSQKPWGTNNEYTCSANFVCPSTTFSEDRLGVRKYRWVIDGVIGEIFSILWQR